MSNDDDELLESIADFMRAQDEAVDARLDRLTRGRLDALEGRTLEDEAKEDPALAEAVRLHQPLSVAFRDRLQAQLLSEAAPRSPPTRQPAAHLRPVPAPAEAPSTSTPIQGRARQPRRWPRRAVTIAAGALAAAALVPLLIVSEPEALPPYALEVSADAWRGATAPSQRVRPDTVVSIVLRPERETAGRVAAALFALRDAPTPVRIEPEHSKDGAVRWRAAASVLAGGRQGDVTLVAVVYRPGVAPLPLEGRADGPRWKALRVNLEVGPQVDAAPPTDTRK